MVMFVCVQSKTRCFATTATSAAAAVSAVTFVAVSSSA